jgi:Tol biopolymer transport system component
MTLKSRILLTALIFVVGLTILTGFAPGVAAQAPDDANQPATVPSPTSTIVFQTAAGGAIYAVDYNTLAGTVTNLRFLTTGMDPAISPDGQQVAFTRWETSQDGALGNVWLINIDGTQERLIHEFIFNPRAPVWSADGTQLIVGMQHGGYVAARRKCGSSPPPRGSKAYDVSSSRDGDGDRRFCYTLPPDPFWKLRRLDLASGSHQDLPGDDYSLSPAWDPLYSGHVVYDGNRGLVNLDLYDNRTWPLTDDFNDHSPVFSPDGTKIAVSYRQDDHWEVHVLNADGSNRQRLTRTSYLELVQQQLRGEWPRSHNNAAPVWSPDGTRLAFLTNRAGPWEIWVMNADGSNPRPLLSAVILGDIALHYNGVDEQMISWR